MPVVVSCQLGFVASCNQLSAGVDCPSLSVVNRGGLPVADQQGLVASWDQLSTGVGCQSWSVANRGGLSVEGSYLQWSAGSGGHCCFPPWFQVQLLVYRSLSHYLLLPWPGMTEKEQDWASRSSHHQTFTARLAKDFIALKDCPSLASSKELQEQGL